VTAAGLFSAYDLGEGRPFAKAYFLAVRKDGEFLFGHLLNSFTASSIAKRFPTGVPAWTL
jgi:hypothetical protein